MARYRSENNLFGGIRITTIKIIMQNTQTDC